MIRKFLLPLLAILGVAFAVQTVIKGSRPPQISKPVTQPARSPYETYVAGAGIIEASSENIAIGVPVGDVVTEVMVKVGDHVKMGDPLFRLKSTVLAAEAQVKKAAVEAAGRKLDRLKAMPRPEDLPPAEAKVKAAEANVEEATAALADVKNQLKMWEGVTNRAAVSQEEVDRRKFAVKVDEARLTSAQQTLESAKADVQLLKAGAWGPDIAVAEADVASARALLRETEADLERHTIKAPVEGEILQVKIHPGEYAQPGPLATPLMLLGNTRRLVVRVDVDENDAWRVARGARAQAMVRGNPELTTALAFERFEPYVVPKKSLTGDATERVDTRVLQVLYSFEKGNLPVYVGQQMDVFIEALPTGGALAGRKNGEEMRRGVE
jgi:HlyD family secretion protein